MVFIDLHELLTEHFSKFLDRSIFGDNTNKNNMVDLRARIEIPHHLISDNRDLENQCYIYFTVSNSSKVNKIDTQRYLNAMADMITSLKNGKVIKYRDPNNKDSILEYYEQDIIVNIKDNDYIINGYVNDVDIDYENDKEISYRIGLKMNVEQKGNYGSN